MPAQSFLEEAFLVCHMENKERNGDLKVEGYEWCIVLTPKMTRPKKGARNK